MRLRHLLTLIRPGVSLAVALGTLCGSVFYGLISETSYISWTAVTGAFLLCAGCSALNQVQERKQDALMKRTARRPLAAGNLSPMAGAIIAGLLMLTGLGLFFTANGPMLLVAGLVVVITYNGLYTPLKPRTPFSLLFGGIAGAMPPMTGWLAAGGNILDPAILTLFGVFYLWQVPHFWLLAEKHRAEYARAGFKLTADRLPPGSRNRIMGLWITAYFWGLSAFFLATGHVGPVAGLLCLLTGAGAALAACTGQTRPAALLVDASLPLAMGGMLIHSW